MKNDRGYETVRFICQHCFTRWSVELLYRNYIVEQDRQCPKCCKQAVAE